MKLNNEMKLKISNRAKRINICFFEPTATYRCNKAK